MPGYEIKCANKNPNGILVRIGGENWSLSVHDAIVKLHSQQIQLFVRVDERLVKVGVQGDGSNAYLVIETDGSALHHMSDLPSC